MKVPRKPSARLLNSPKASVWVGECRGLVAGFFTLFEIWSLNLDVWMKDLRILKELFGGWTA